MGVSLPTRYCSLRLWQRRSRRRRHSWRRKGGAAGANPGRATQGLCARRLTSRGPDLPALYFRLHLGRETVVAHHYRQQTRREPPALRRVRRRWGNSPTRKPLLLSALCGLLLLRIDEEAFSRLLLNEPPRRTLPDARRLYSRDVRVPVLPCGDNDLTRREAWSPSQPMPLPWSTRSTRDLPLRPSVEASLLRVDRSPLPSR